MGLPSMTTPKRGGALILRLRFIHLIATIGMGFVGLHLFSVNTALAEITIAGETVHVETDNYEVQFDRGVITYIHNKHTDTTYTLSGEGRRGWTGLLREKPFLAGGKHINK